jgi:hypothetical protein
MLLETLNSPLTYVLDIRYEFPITEAFDVTNKLPLTVNSRTGFEVFIPTLEVKIYTLPAEEFHNKLLLR